MTILVHKALENAEPAVRCDGYEEYELYSLLDRLAEKTGSKKRAAYEMIELIKKEIS